MTKNFIHHLYPPVPANATAIRLWLCSGEATIITRSICCYPLTISARVVCVFCVTFYRVYSAGEPNGRNLHTGKVQRYPARLRVDRCDHCTPLIWIRNAVHLLAKLQREEEEEEEEEEAMSLAGVRKEELCAGALSAMCCKGGKHHTLGTYPVGFSTPARQP